MEFTMVWTEATRRQYRRDGLRYASNLTYADRASPHDLPAGRGQRDPVSRLDRVPMAPTAKGVSALFDRAGLLLCLVTGWHLRADQPCSRGRLAREGRTRGE